MSESKAESSKTRSTSAHFRIWTDVYDSLESEAGKRGISLNLLVNQVLATFSRLDLQIAQIGYVKLSKEIYRLALKMIPDDKLEPFGREIAKGVGMTHLRMKGDMTLEGVLDHLHRMSMEGFFSVQETKRGGKRIIVLTHDLGERFSLAFEASLATLFEQVGAHPKIEGTDLAVVIET